MFTSAKEGIFCSAFVCLFACLSVSNLTKELPIGSSYKFHQRCNLSADKKELVKFWKSSASEMIRFKDSSILLYRAFFTIWFIA